LFAISATFKAAVSFRNQLFDRGWLPIYCSKKFVVSIGNIACGGTGKTSFVELLARKVNLPVAILERGYKAKKRKKEPFFVSSPDEGDEAYMLAHKMQFAQVIIGKKRKESAKLAEILPVNYILMDDGMQHRYLHRDLEIVIVHARDLFGKGYFLPKGALRESPKRLAKADYIVINGAATEETFHNAKTQLQTYTDAPCIGISYKVPNSASWQGKKVAAFCGIGKPDEFYKLLKSIGCELVMTKSYPDHSYFNGIDAFIDVALEKGVEVIVCTEKDFVKMQNKKNVTFLPIETSVNFGEEHFLEMVRYILSNSV
jgi:tetraacyldisaccharide 4'-kinase